MPVGVALDLAFPSEGVQVIATETPHGHDVEVLVVVDDGRLSAREVVVRQVDDGPPVTSEALRLVPVATLVQWAGRHLRHVRSVREGQVVLDAGPADETEFARAKQQGMTDETLQLVARTYRVAVLMGRPPVRVIEEWFELPRSTAGRWVTAARKRGYLEPAAGPGRIGGGRVPDAQPPTAPVDDRGVQADEGYFASLDEDVKAAQERWRQQHGER